MARPDDEEAQYATYPAEKVIESTTAPVWTPLPLRPFIYIPYILFLILLAVGLEVAFHFSQKNSGYPVLGDPAAFAKRSGVWHYVYTLPLVALAMFVVGVWAWTDIEIKKLQPYVDLVQGDSPPHRSLLLDYTRQHNFFVWTQALRNKHYTVFLASILAIVSLAFQPLASALLDVRDIWWSLPQTTSYLTSTPNLAGSPSSSAFLSASGFASAQANYVDLPNPPFVKSDGWTLSELNIPPGLPPNGTTITYNTTAIKTLTNCRSIPVNMQQDQSTAGNWINTINDQATSCGLTFNVSRTGPSLFGASVALCSNATITSPTPQSGAGKNETNPVVFWFFTYQPVAKASATMCTPQIQLFDVTATLTLPAVELANVVTRGTGSNTGNITTGLQAPSSPNSLVALNGLDLPTEVTSIDSAVRERLAGVRVTLSAAIFQSATKDGIEVQSAFDSDRFVAISDSVYTTYLSLLARTLYFTTPEGSLPALPLTIKTTVKRLFISAFSAHFLTVLLLLLALLSLFVHASHTYARRNLHLRHLPGTIASAVSIGGQTGTSVLLGEGDGGKGGGMTDKELKELLREKKFRIDPRTMKIVMEGEEGYTSLGGHSGSPNSSPTRGEFLWVADLGDRIRRRSAQLVGGGEERRKSRRLSSLPTAATGGAIAGQRSPGFREHIIEADELDEAQTPKTSTPGHKERDPLLKV